MKRGWCLPVLLLVAAGCKNEQTRTVERAGTTEGSAMTTSLSAADRDFVVQAAVDGTAEVKLGEMAQQHGMNQAVKDFGRRMVEDHGKANAELMNLASRKGLQVATEADAKHKRIEDRLAKLKGADFDRGYARQMVEDHREDVAAFRRQAQRAQDPDLRAFAKNTLPVLEEHLRMAEDMQKSVGAR